MTGLRNKNFIRIILLKVPVILLFVSVLNDYDFNYSGLKYFSFNFSYILIFYYSLKKTESLGYTYIFIAGLFNDVVIGMNKLVKDGQLLTFNTSCNDVVTNQPLG